MIACDYGISDSASSGIRHSWMTSSSLWGNQILKEVLRNALKTAELAIDNKERPIVQG